MFFSRYSNIFLGAAFCINPFLGIGQSITTFVGNGTPGYFGDGGPGHLAHIAYPIGVNLDNSGNLVIGVSGANGFIRKINSTTNIITTIAGSDTATSIGGWGNGGPATCALLLSCYAVSYDESGNFYIADFGHNQVRCVNILTGIIDAYAGTGVAGSTGDGGPATAARFNSIGCVLVDTVNDKLYVSDAFNYKVRVVDMTTGIITAFAGTGISGYSGDGVPATSTKFSRVMGLCNDRAGNVYIGDWDNARIRKVDIGTGIVTTYAGSGVPGYDGDNGPASAAKIAKPISLCMDSCDNMYFADEDNQVVRRIDAFSGIITTVAGNGTAGFSGDGGPATTAQFNHPTGVKIDNAGNMYIGDYFNHRVRKITIVPPPLSISVSISPSPNDTVCAGATVTYIATTSGTAPTSYQWYKNGVVVSSSGSTYTHVPADGDSIRCVATASPCGHTPVWASSNMVIMEVVPLDVPTISLSGITTASVGAAVTVNAAVSGTGSSYTIKWLNNGTQFATTTVPTVTYTKAAGIDTITARVVPTVTYCYDSTTSAPHYVNESTVNVAWLSHRVFSVFPNPGHNTLSISGAEVINSVTVTNLVGEVLINEHPDKEALQIIIAHLPPGMYLLRVNARYVQRFMKE